jgi:hypothetical protein
MSYIRRSVSTSDNSVPLRSRRTGALSLRLLPSVAPSHSPEQIPTDEPVDVGDETRHLDELIRYLGRLRTEVLDAVLADHGDPVEPEVEKVIRHLEVQPAERVEMALLSQDGPIDAFSVLVYLEQHSTDQLVRERARRAIEHGMERLTTTVLTTPEPRERPGPENP